MENKKIIQIVPHFAGGGLGAYIINLNNGLKQCGYDVEVYRFLSDPKFNNLVDNNFEFKDVEINDETIADLNNADYVFVNDMPLMSHEENFREAYFNMIMNLKSKVILFNNAHKLRSLTKNYGKYKLDKELLNKVYKIVAFSKNCEYFKKVKEIIGEDEANSKYVHLMLPYQFDKTKKNWKPFEEKAKLITYFGRAVKIKSPERIIKMQPKLVENGMNGEIRGVSRSIAITGFEDMIYKFINGRATKEKSDKTLFINNKWKTNNGYDKLDNLFDVADRNGKVYVFTEYKYEDRLELISKPFFGADFYHLDNHEYGDTLEYALYDIVDSGTIPVYDSDVATNVCLYKDGKKIDTTFGEAEMGLFLNENLSNLDELIEKMKYIINNKEYFDEFRNKIFDKYCEYADPKGICTQLINEIENLNN